MYKLIKDISNNEIIGVIRKSDYANIPFCNGNRDYEEYLEWVAEGNTPEPADE